MSLLDSVPCFEARVREFDLTDHLERFKALGWNTLGVLAFSSDYVPGVSDGAIFVKDVVLPALQDPEHADRFKLRRLYTEAFTIAAYELRRRCEQNDDDAPRTLHSHDREHRRKQVARRLVGLRIEGDLEPSFRLQDLSYELFDRNVVKHIPWDACTKRESELEGARTDKSWKVDSSGFVKESSVSEPTRADTRTDFMLMCALRRRAISLEMADVADFETMERVTDVLLRELHRAPPPGYAKVSLEQLRRADLELFRQLAELCREGVRRGPDGRRPFDAHIPDIIISPQFRYLLMPLPGAPPGRTATSDDVTGSSSDRRDAKRLHQSVQDLRAENKRLRLQSASSSSYSHQPSGGKGSKGGGRGKGRDKGSNRAIRMPTPLIGKSNLTPAGEPICFSYNLAIGCTQASPGAKCPRGWHVCAEPGCHASHSITHHGAQ